MTVNSKQSQPQIVIIGAGYAGMIAAQRLAAWTQAQITVINAVDVFVERIRLHQQSAGQMIKQHRIAKILNPKVRFMVGMVTHIDPNAQSLRIKSADHAQPEISLHYDYLVYALGSRIDRDGVPGLREYAYTLDHQDSARLRDALVKAQTHGGRLLVAGGGLTGVEAATELAEAYPLLRVTLVTRGRLAEHISDAGYAHLQKTFKRLNIELREYTQIERFETHRVELAGNQAPILFDVALWVGAFSVPQLAKESGIQTNARGQILVDDYLRSVSHPTIFAAGDSAVLANHTPLRMACATALPLGGKVAENLRALLQNKPMKPFRFGYTLQCISLGRHDALVQWVNADDVALPKIHTGWLGTFVKEAICKMTLFVVRNERYLPGLYQYPQPEFNPITQSVYEVEHGRA